MSTIDTERRAFRLTGPRHEPLTIDEVDSLAWEADESESADVRQRAIARLGRGGWFAPPGWRPRALTPLLPASEQVSCYDAAAEKASRTALGLDATPPLSPIAELRAAITEEVDISGCGAPGKRHRYDADRLCKKCKRPDPRASSRKITPPAQPANRKPDGCLEVGVGPVCEGPGAASFDAAAGSALGEPTGGTYTVLPSEPLPCTPAPISPASQGGSQTAGTVEDSLAATVPAALPRDRRTYLGSADAPAVLGLSPHSTLWDVWAKKVGVVEDSAGPWLEMGLDLEPVIAKWAARKLGATAMRKGTTLLHPGEPWAGETIDYLMDLPGGEVANVECKALGSWSAWRDDEVPLHIVGQVHWQTGIAKAAGQRIDRIFVARFRGLEVEVFEVRYEPALFAAMLAKCKPFWAQVESKTPPPIDGSESATAWLRSLYPAAKNPLRKATDAEVAEITRYVVARTNEGVNKAKKEESANRLRAMIGASEGIESPELVAKWTGKDGARRLDVRVRKVEAKAEAA